MFCIIYLLSNKKDKEIEKIKEVVNEELLDKTIMKYIFEEFKEMDSSLLDEIKHDFDLETKNLNKKMNSFYKEQKIFTIKIPIKDIISKKEINEIKSVFELSPTLSFFVKEDHVQKNIIYENKLISDYSKIRIESNIIFICESKIQEPLKALFKRRNINEIFFFKNNFNIPIKTVLYEYKNFLN